MVKIPTYKIVLFGIAVITQLFVIGWMITSHENVLKNGVQYKMKTVPIHPYDPFRGRYVRLRIDDKLEIVSRNAYKVNDPVYAILDVDELGFASVSSIQRETPSHPKFIKTTIKRVSAYVKNRDDKNKSKIEVHQVTLDLPFQRFYLEESMAPEAEALYWDRQRSDVDSYITVRVLKGKAVLEELFFNGIPVSEFIKSSRNNPSIH